MAMCSYLLDAGDAYLSAAESLKLLAAFTSQKVLKPDHQQQHNYVVTNGEITDSDTLNYARSSGQIFIILCIMCLLYKVPKGSDKPELLRHQNLTPPRAQRLSHIHST